MACDAWIHWTTGPRRPSREAGGLKERDPTINSKMERRHHRTGRLELTWREGAAFGWCATLGSKDLRRLFTGDGVGAVDRNALARPNNVVDSKVFDGGGNADVVAGVVSDFVYGVGHGGDAMAGAKDGVGGRIGSFVLSGSRGIGCGWSWGFRWRSRGIIDGVGIGNSDMAAGACSLLGDGDTVIAVGKAFRTRVVVHSVERALEVTEKGVYLATAERSGSNVD